MGEACPVRISGFRAERRWRISRVGGDMQETFRLVYIGRFAAGKTADDVKEALSSRLGIGETTIDKIISTNTIILKKNMDADQAARYQKAFESAGLICRLDKEAPSATPPGLIQCPKCGHQQPKADECTKCGVVIAKAQAMKKKETARLKSLAVAKPIQDLLTEYKDMLVMDRAFFAPKIPASKSRAASNVFGPWPSNETPLFLYDNSVSQDDAQGLVITDRGLYGKGNFGKPYFFPLNSLNQTNVKLGFSGGLQFDGKWINDLVFMSGENRLVFSEMLHDLSGDKRILIPFGQEINDPEMCCGCLSTTDLHWVTVRLLSKPPKSAGSKAAGFVFEGILFNVSPIAFLIARGLANARKAAAGDGFMPAELKLPYCSRCTPTDSSGKPMDEMHTWSGNALEAGRATVKTGFAWFDVFFKNPHFAEKLMELNPHTIFPSWIKMSTHKAEDTTGAQDQTGEAGTAEVEIQGPPVDHAEVFASLVQGATSFAAANIPEKKLNNAKASFASVDSDETVVGLHDFTLFGSAKEGVVFTDKGVYWKGGKNQGHMPYKEIKLGTIHHTKVEGTPAVMVTHEKWLPFTAMRAADLEWVVTYLRRVCG